MKSLKLILASVAALTLSASAFADEITIVLGQGERSLPDCGGTVEATKSEGQGAEQVNVIFRHVENCTSYKVKKVNGDKTYEKSHELQGSYGKLHASHTLKKTQRENGDFGWEDVEFTVFGENGNPHDVVNVQFINVPAAPSIPTYPTLPPPPVGNDEGGGSL